MRQLLQHAPLTELSEHTDEIIIGHLGLPSGFDASQLEVNVSAFRLMQKTGLGVTTVYAAEGEAGQVDYMADGLGPSGAATLLGISKRPKKPLASTEVRFEGMSELDNWFGKPDVTIRLNKAEIQERIKADGNEKREFDAHAQAKYLNMGIKRGLSEASFHANVDMYKFVSSACAYASSLPALVPSLGHKARMMGMAAGFLASEVGQGCFFSKFRSDRMDQTYSKSLAEYRWSLTMGISFDRWLAGTALAGAQHFIRASKASTDRH